MALTYKQRLFVDYYLGESQGNATDAARKAGYREPNTQGPRLLVNVGIRAAIDSRLESSAMRSKEVLARLSEIASGDLGDFIHLNEDDTWKLSLRKAKRRKKLGLLRKLKNKRETRFESTGNGDEKEPVIVDQLEIELLDQLSALDKLARYHNLYKEREPEEINLVELAKRLKQKRDQLRPASN